jgi:hypothetical protein
MSEIGHLPQIGCADYKNRSHKFVTRAFLVILLSYGIEERNAIWNYVGI